MNRTSVEILDFYDEEVVNLIQEKYGFSPMEAFRRFIMSETYQMLSDPKLEMWEFGPPGILDMWENELVTGDPRNSLYIRG